MQAKDIMRSDVVSVTPDTLITEVDGLLNSKGISGVPVVNESGIVVGLITEAELFSGDHKFYLPSYANLINQSDFVMGAKKELPYEAGRVMRITAEEIMNKQVYFAPADIELNQLLDKVSSLEQNPIPVVDNANKLLGIISKGDLLRLVAGKDTHQQMVKKPRYVDNEFKIVEKDLTRRYSFISKNRANFWIITAAILFIIGFLAGMVYVVNPRLFINSVGGP